MPCSNDVRGALRAAVSRTSPATYHLEPPFSCLMHRRASTVLDKTLLDYERNGLGLEPEQRERFKAIKKGPCLCVCVCVPPLLTGAAAAAIDRCLCCAGDGGSNVPRRRDQRALHPVPEEPQRGHDQAQVHARRARRSARVVLRRPHQGTPPRSLQCELRLGRPADGLVRA